MVLLCNILVCFFVLVPLQIDLKPIEHVRVRNDHELDTILGSDNLVKLNEHSYLVSKLEPKIELE